MSHSVLLTSADASPSQPSSRSRIQASPQPDHSSGAPDKSTALTSQRNLSAGVVSALGSATATPLPAAASPSPAPSAALSATQSAPQPAVQSATPPILFAQPAPQVPLPVGSHLPSGATPEPPHTIDSGQLRVTPHNSELKISVQLPELGKVEVRAVTTRDVTTAHLTAFRHEALPVLAAERAGLEQALKSRDVLLGSFASHAQGHSAGQQRQHNSPSSTPSAAVAPTTASAISTATAEAGIANLLPDYASISLHA